MDVPDDGVTQLVYDLSVDIMDFSVLGTAYTGAENPESTHNWNVMTIPDDTMEGNEYRNATDDYLAWSDDLKISISNVKSMTSLGSSATCMHATKYDGHTEPKDVVNGAAIADDNTRLTRKRKAMTTSTGVTCKKNPFYNAGTTGSGNAAAEDAHNDVVAADVANRRPETCGDSQTVNGAPRIPTWQVDDLTDNLAADLDGSLSGLGADLASPAYNMGDALLSLPSLQVFKQEAPSPPNNHHEHLGGTGGAAALAKISSSGNPAAPPTTVNGILTERSDTNNNHNPGGVNTSLQHLINSYSDPAVVSSSGIPQIQDNFNRSVVTSSDHVDDNRFQYVLAAATSIATKVNEDTLTYLNQGQSYEIKLKKLGDLSNYKGKSLKSVIGICFHERRMQYGERERLSQWQSGRPGDRVLEVDVPLSYGLAGLQQPALNTVTFNWDPTCPVGVYIKVNCISTEFTPKKHGGEKGVPFRIQVETYDTSAAGHTPGLGRRLHAAACQIKVFKLKGADRKHKQDREKIFKRPVSEQDKYQPSYDCTVLNDISYDNVYPALTTTNTANVVPPIPVSSTPRNNFTTPPLLPQAFVKGEDPITPTAPAPPPINLTNPGAGGGSIGGGVVTTPSHPEGQVPATAAPLNHNHQEFNNVLTTCSTAEETVAWLTHNRFSAYLATFVSFSGADILRLTRDDLIQICGLADGIRLFNALHSKTIAPKLTLYICAEQSAVFNAVFLSAFSSGELAAKLAALVHVTADQVQGLYMQGPNAIHIHISDDVIRHFKNETMFSVDLIPEMGRCKIVLKPLTH